jgi:hypothetical protein
MKTRSNLGAIATILFAFSPTEILAFTPCQRPSRLVTPPTRTTRIYSTVQSQGTLQQIAKKLSVELNELVECGGIVFSYVSKPEKDVNVEDVVRACDLVDESGSDADGKYVVLMGDASIIVIVISAYFIVLVDKASNASSCLQYIPLNDFHYAFSERRILPQPTLISTSEVPRIRPLSTPRQTPSIRLQCIHYHGRVSKSKSYPSYGVTQRARGGLQITHCKQCLIGFYPNIFFNI